MRFVLALLLCATPALAQHNHDRGHNDYLDWASRLTGNCCSDKDCGSLKDDEIRETETGTEIKIGGEWCPVLPMHRIIRGKSPDWSVSHACVRPQQYFPDVRPCDRLLCFTGRGGF